MDRLDGKVLNRVFPDFLSRKREMLGLLGPELLAPPPPPSPLPLAQYSDCKLLKATLFTKHVNKYLLLSFS